MTRLPANQAARAATFTLLLLLLARPPAGAQPPAEPDPSEAAALQVFVGSSRLGLDQVALSYPDPVTDEQARADFAALAAQLGQAAVAPTIRREPRPGQPELPFVEAEANLSGLVNWQAGHLNVRALVDTFRRYERINVVFLFFEPFPLRSPPPEGEHEGVRWRQTAGSERAASYQIWLEPEPGASARRGGGNGVEWQPIVGIGLIALVVGAGVFWILRILAAARSPAPPGE